MGNKIETTTHDPRCSGTDCWCDEIPTMSYEAGVERGKHIELTRLLMQAARDSNHAPRSRKAA